MTTLNALPNEILSLVTYHLERPQDVLHLALANRRLAEFVKLDGWKAFLKGRFGLKGLDADARNSVHGLTTLYRNWHRKGFIVRYLEPSVMTTSINTWQKNKWRGPTGQTMGYRPSIDSYEETFGAWLERREVLAWSAGTQIVVRVKETGHSAESTWHNHSEQAQSDVSTHTFDAFGHRSAWYTYKIPDSFEGRDDINNIKLLRPHQRNGDFEGLAFGSVSGHLSVLSWDSTHKDSQEQQYDTGNRTVDSLSVSQSKKPMLAAILGNSTLALYPIKHDSASHEQVEPLAQTTPIPPGPGAGRIWSCTFLSDDKVAIGLGQSEEPVRVYDITPDGSLLQPPRSFGLDFKSYKGSRTNQNMNHRTSVYPIVPIPGTARAGSDAGNVFLSGGYDGLIRLHDLRSPRNFEIMYWDPTNDSSVYSLAIQGLERIVAGVSMHSMIKVFDLRLSGSHAYHTMPSPPKPRRKSQNQDYAYNAIVNNAEEHTATVSGGWNLYLNPRNPPKRDAYREDYSRGGHNSAIYSLSIPSPTSPNIYAGRVGAVQSLTFHAIADLHPDPLLSQSLVRFPDSDAIDIKSSYNPQGDALNLGMYEQGTEEGLVMQLLVQDRITEGVAKNKEQKGTLLSNDFDERWRDPRDESIDRWERSTISQGSERERGRGRGRGRGGRGRGRGRSRGSVQTV
jgi:WD40 repeat protein